MTSAFEYLADEPFELESAYPYTGKGDGCKADASKGFGIL